MAKQKPIFTAPWYPWYVNDVLTSERVACLSLAEEGAYRRALDSAWKHGSIPADPKLCAAVIGKNCSAVIAKKVLEMFEMSTKDNERKISKKLEQIRAEQAQKFNKKSKMGKENIAKRWKHTTSGDSSAIPTVYQTNTNRDSKRIAKNSIQNQNQNQKEEEEKKELSEAESSKERPPPLLEIHLGKILSGIAAALGLKTQRGMSNRNGWIEHGTIAFENGFTAEQFVECFTLLRQQRSYAIKPNYVTDNLPDLDRLRKRSTNGIGQRLPSTADKQADAAEARKNLRPPPGTGAK